MKTIIALSVAAISLAATAANIVLIGDSTLAPRTDAVKLGSWGDSLKPLLAPGNGIVNRSVGGRTVRTTKPGWATNLPSEHPEVANRASRKAEHTLIVV